MLPVQDKLKSGVQAVGTQTLAAEMKLLQEMHEHNGIRKELNNELWHACAGPLVSLPQVGSLVYYFPQGHIEQVAASTKRASTSQMPNYPNLPSQLLCQVQNVTLHADKDTDEIYAQMSLQPVNSEKNAFSVPDFRLKPSKHPCEFFCKTLTASDTSTHGGFSVPRRAAEKLFPSLDYTIQPPSQELVVRDLHDNIWTFRHIYRGQPKRHLLTTGWSLFVGSKRLRAGDCVLFIRDEKSQLLIGVRRANRQQTTLPSLVLSADCMHIGVLAAAAHAASNRTPFTIFYNPRACPSEFVISLTKYRKAVFGTQLSVGMRFGMMFETEESGKRRYMGTIIGVSDLDVLRWPGSKWRNIQVEWDEAGCGDKPKRVSSWEIEAPENLFIFPSLTNGVKRPLYSAFFRGETEREIAMRRAFVCGPENASVDIPYFLPYQYSEHSTKTLKCQPLTDTEIFSSRVQQEFTAKVDLSQDARTMLLKSNHFSHPKYSETMQLQQHVTSQSSHDQPVCTQSNSLSKVYQSSKLQIVAKIGSPPHSGVISDGSSSLKSEVLVDQPTTTLTSIEDHCVETLAANSVISQNHVGQLTSENQNQALQQLQTNISSGTARSSGDFSLLGSQNHSYILPGVYNPTLLSTSHQMLDDHLGDSRSFPLANQLSDDYPEAHALMGVPSSNNLKDLSDESKSNNHSGIYGIHNIDASCTHTAVDPSVSNVILDEYCTLKDDCIVGNLSSSQDVQSQITCASLAESHTFSWQDFHDNSGGTSSSNIYFDESCLLQKGSWQQITPPIRTYTKVQKAGSVGRSIDVTNFRNYGELCSAIERMFGLEGLLNDTKGSGWKLVYVDYENDVLLVGDDPWEEFVGCVRCIRILSPSEVKQMSEEGMKLLNSAAMQGICGSMSG